MPSSRHPHHVQPLITQDISLSIPPLSTPPSSVAPTIPSSITPPQFVPPALTSLKDLIATQLQNSCSSDQPANNVVVTVTSDDKLKEVIVTPTVSARADEASLHSSDSSNVLVTPLPSSETAIDECAVKAASTTSTIQFLSALAAQSRSADDASCPASAPELNLTTSVEASLLAPTTPSLPLTLHLPVPNALTHLKPTQCSTNTPVVSLDILDPITQDHDPKNIVSEVPIVPMISLSTSRVAVSGEMLRSALTSFWVPFLSVCGVYGSFVPLQCVSASPTQRWTAFIQTVCGPCCPEVQNIVRLSALAFGVRKLVSLKANELCSKVVLYNHKLDDMAEIFRIRSVQVTAFLGLDDSHDCFQKVLVEINKCWEGYDRCTDRPCALPTFKGIGSMRFPLNRWQIILKADVLQANKLLRNMGLS